MRKLYGMALVLSILSLHPATASTVSPVYTAVFCTNGFQNAYNVLIVDDETGCMVVSWGVDCNGKEYINQCVKHKVDADPNWTYTDIHLGVASDGTPYYIKADIVSGVVTKLWGQDAHGEYYVADMVAQER